MINVIWMSRNIEFNKSHITRTSITFWRRLYFKTNFVIFSLRIPPLTKTKLKIHTIAVLASVCISNIFSGKKVSKTWLMSAMTKNTSLLHLNVALTNQDLKLIEEESKDTSLSKSKKQNWSYEGNWTGNFRISF